jgi:hypothetical protein
MYVPRISKGEPRALKSFFTTPFFRRWKLVVRFGDS